ncbi:MAG: HAD family hydrolase [Bdellovibrio sp.]
MNNIAELKLVIFDLDGTLVDSQLNFDLMREEMGLPKGMPILEELEKIENLDHKKSLTEIVLRHEIEGAHKAQLMPGVEEFLRLIRSRNIKTAILTRNHDLPVEITLKKIPHKFDIVMTRSHYLPPKPNPAGLIEICRLLQTQIDQAIYIGDYKFDLDAAKNAGMKSILYAPTNQVFEDLADLVIRHFDELSQLMLD